jgi:hypothetical protein
MSKGRGWVAMTIVAVAAIVGIGKIQPGLAANVHKIRQRDDVFLLPPPAELRAITFGYRAAATDLMWATLILEYGLHAQEKRPFTDVTRYIDGILALEPDFEPLYRFVDTILVYSGRVGTPEDARTARRYLERGTRERPYDPAIWLQYGQFIAFIAPTFLTDEAEIERWRVDGASAIGRAVELGSDAQRSLAATTILGKSGERKATIEHLQRAYALTDDAEMRFQIRAKLLRLQGSAEAEDAIAVVEREWRARYNFLSRGEALLVGPHRAVAKCAGPASYEVRGCPRDWSAAIAERR